MLSAPSMALSSSMRNLPLYDRAGKRERDCGKALCGFGKQSPLRLQSTAFFFIRICAVTIREIPTNSKATLVSKQMRKMPSSWPSHFFIFHVGIPSLGSQNLPTGG